MANIIVVTFVLAVMTSWIGTSESINLARRFGILDLPGAAKIHAHPTPRFGGFGIFLAILCVSLVMLLWHDLWDWPLLLLLAGIVLTAAVGAADDVYNLSPHKKLAGQLLGAFLIVAGGWRFDFLPWPWLAAPLAIFYLVASSNALNLLDGMDALASVITFVAALSFAIIFWTRQDLIALVLALALMGGCLGFLRFNWHPAITFMGDIGSLPLGLTLGILALHLTRSWDWPALIGPLLILYPLVFDTGLGILRRWRHKKPLFEPDRGHVYDQLRQQGFSYWQTLLVMVLISTLCGLAGVWITLVGAPGSALAALIIVGGVSILFAHWRGFLAYQG